MFENQVWLPRLPPRLKLPVNGKLIIYPEIRNRFYGSLASFCCMPSFYSSVHSFRCLAQFQALKTELGTDWIKSLPLESFVLMERVRKQTNKHEHTTRQLLCRRIKQCAKIELMGGYIRQSFQGHSEKAVFEQKPNGSEKSGEREFQTKEAASLSSKARMISVKNSKRMRQRDQGEQGRRGEVGKQTREAGHCKDQGFYPEM